MFIPHRRHSASYHSLAKSKSPALRLQGKPAELRDMFGWAPRGPEGAWEHVVFLQESGGWLRKRGTAKKGQTLTSFLGTTVNEKGKAFNKILAPRQKIIIIFSRHAVANWQPPLHLIGVGLKFNVIGTSSYLPTYPLPHARGVNHLAIALSFSSRKHRKALAFPPVKVAFIEKK